jgi:hypothetical protein
MARRFAQAAAENLLTQPATIGVSTMKEVLTVAGLDDAQSSQVATTYTAAGNRTEFWSSIEQQIGADATKRLATAGQLAYLTVNNAPLVERLGQLAANGGPVALVHQGLYEPKAWRPLVDGVTIPADIPGADDAEKRANYTNLLAAQLEISFPTAIAAAMITRQELTLSEPGASDEVATFLTEHQGKFELGEQPVERYLRDNAIQLSDRGLAATKTLQCQYQISPSNAALKTLAANRIDSAYAATRFDQADFVTRFGAAFGGADVANAVFLKAQQVHTTTFSVATGYLMAKTQAGIYSVPRNDPTPPQNAAPGSDVIAYATLEQLFGELDYCTCSDCASVLSPAAYLVDLLMFTDLRRYDSTGTELPASYNKENPYDVLISRRPDLPEIKLTCENTNVALPYLDLVNEVLEYFVVNKTLTNFTGYDVDPDETSAELLASPHHTNLAAYPILAGAKFLLDLPFHRALAALRAYVGRVNDLTLAEVMEALRTSDALDRGAAAYGWRDIEMERLGISRAEYAILTDSSEPLGDLYGQDGATDDATIAVIGNAKAFARLLELDYDQVVDLVGTRFVNPQSKLLSRLDRLQISLETIKAHHDGTVSDAQLDAMLPTELDKTPYDGDVKTWLADHYDAIGTLLVLADPDGTDVCSFDTVRIQHALSGDPLTAVEALRMLRFVRLWRRVGWTMQQVDAALTALWPEAQLPQPGDDEPTGRAKLDAGFDAALIKLGELTRLLDRLGLTVKRDLGRALALWGPIDARGPGSLYYSMFLARSIVEPDPAFAEDSSGDVLTAPGKLVDHIRALEPACSLKGGELQPILDAVGFDANTDLTIDNVSVVFRWALLARRLRLSTKELVALTQLTGLDPFVVPTAAPSELTTFLDIADQVRAAGLRIPLLMYLLQHQLQRGAPDDASLRALAKTWHDDLARIKQENSATEDPNGDIARAKMALVYDQATADLFLGLVTGTVGFDVAYAQLTPTLPPTVVAAGPGLRYDHLAKRLSNAGPLTQAQRDTIQALPATTPALSAAVGALYTAAQTASQALFAKYSELQTLYDTVLALPAAERVASVLGAFLPELQRKLQEQDVLQKVATEADTTTADAARVLGDPQVLHKVGDPTAPAVADLMAIGIRGASSEVYDGNDVVGVPSTVTLVVDSLDYAAGGDHPLPRNSGNPVGKVSGVWHFLLDPPANGFYAFAIETDAGGTVDLTIDDQPITVALVNGRWETQDPSELHAGTLAEFRLTVRGVRDRLAVNWQTTGVPDQVIPTDRLFPGTTMDAFAASYVRLLKAFSLATQLDLDGDELAWFGSLPALQIGGEGFLNALPVEPGASAATVQALFKAVVTLCGYTGLRGDLKLAGPPDRSKFLDLLRDPAARNEVGTSVRSDLTGWHDDQVAAILAHLGMVETDLGAVDAVRRVERVVDLASAIGIPAGTLIGSVTNDPTDDQLADMQAALRARYDEDAWYQIIQPVNDQLREQQRDALVSYVLHYLSKSPNTAHIDTPNKLYEWFLIDVEMASCTVTSRIRLALSTIQLFVQRCLMNLEPRVAASSINAKRWSWMQRYRVWEANRKVFLMPEDWLEPELRDDKSPLYKQLEGDLLSADITDEAAAIALGGYLTGLAEVAKLEIEGMFVEEYDSGPADDIVHVVGRTAGARRKYYYRRQSRNAWSAWVPIKLDIEDSPVTPVVWNGRLFVFWLRVLEGQPPAQAATTAQTPKPITEVQTSELRTSGMRRVQAMLQWSEYFNGTWQPVHTSDAAKPLVLDDMSVDAFDRGKLQLSSSVDSDGSLVMAVSYGTRGSHFRLYTPHSLPVRAEDEPPGQVSLITVLFSQGRDLNAGNGLSIDYFDPFLAFSDWFFTHQVLGRGRFSEIVEPRHLLTNVFGAPFFFQDRVNVLFVRPTPMIIKVPDYGGIVVTPADPKLRLDELPRIRLVADPRVPYRVPDRGDPYPGQVYNGLTESTPAGSYLAGPNIRSEIGSLGTFAFGDQQIGPAGAVQAIAAKGISQEAIQ